MFDKISNDGKVNTHCPYKLSDVKSSGFDNISCIFMPKFESSFSLKKEKPPITEDMKLYDSWKNVNSKLSPAFFKEVVNISKEIKCDPEDLIALMYGESELNPKKTSDNGKNHGLIQFNDVSLKNAVKEAFEEGRAENLRKDITVENLKKLSAEQQLPYVKAYLITFKKYCGLKNKKLSGAELWGMIKSPKKTKERDSKFFNNIEKDLDSIKKSVLKYEIPFYLERRD